MSVTLNPITVGSTGWGATVNDYWDDITNAFNGSEAIDGLKLNKDDGTDPTIQFAVGGTTKYTMGIDNSDANDVFKIGTTAVETNTRLVIDNNGNFTIGSSNPTEKLTVEGNTLAEESILNKASGDPFVQFQIAGTSKFTVGVDDTDSDKFKIGTTALETGTSLTIDSSGNVGIGTDSPSEKLTVGGNTLAEESILNKASGDPFVQFQIAGTSKFTVGVDDTDSDKFKIGTTALETGTSLTIDSSGNVGIGADSPGALLDVRGTAIFNEDGGDFDFRIEGDTDANLFFTDAGNDRVGIGTNTPSEKLQVSGKVLSDSLESDTLELNTGGTTNVALTIDGVASQTADFVQVKNNSGTILTHIDENGQVFLHAGSSAPGDGDFQNSQVTLWLDESNDEIEVKAKKSNGTTISSTIGSGSGGYDYIFLQDEKTNNTSGGTFTKDDWRTRDINKEAADEGGHASISSNQITLAAGTYIAFIRCCTHQVGHNKVRLLNKTPDPDETLLLGDNNFAPGGTNEMTWAMCSGRFTLEETSTLEVQHYCKTTKADNGFGLANNIDSQKEIYTCVEFWKES